MASPDAGGVTANLTYYGNMSQALRSALIVCTRRIGDVLLATPVIRSLKAALPNVMIDMLVFEGTQDIL
ncbi:MAG: hypothetical protein CCU26_13620, partial [Nitrospira sp. UW-LDO-01]